MMPYIMARDSRNRCDRDNGLREHLHRYFYEK